MSASIEERIRHEVEGLHAFLQEWFRGSLGEDQFQPCFMDRFARDFILIPPAGTALSLDQLALGIRGGYGSNPAFTIAIHNLSIRRRLDHHILATYEEWQRHALASRPPDNARIATVLFAMSEPIKWLHLHETWLPAAATSPWRRGDRGAEVH